MSTLKADTIQSTGGGPVTLTKQEATKHWVNYDAVDTTTDGSLNQSSLTDHSTGEFSSNFTNNFSSATDKCHLASCLNSANGGAGRVADITRGGSLSSLGHAVADTYNNLLSTSQIQFYTGYGSSGANDGAVYDMSASYCTSIGDLA
jgi:hypothetical protein